MRVLVVGAGRTGRAVARFCARRGDEVTLTDRRPDALAGETLPAGLRLELGGHREASFLLSELIVVSPGVPEIPELVAARRGGVPVIGEIELAAREVRAPIAGITGTNGKSTTTALLGALCARSGRPTFCGGNLGTPFIEAAGTPAAGPQGLCVVELSSFQLETIDRFRPRVAMLLNVTPDHLDRYPSMAAYGQAKARIFENQGPEDFAVVNADDPPALALAAGARSRIVPFSSTERLAEGAFVEGERLVVALPWLDSGTFYFPVSELPLVGRHNLENALAAFLGARLLGVPAEAIAAATRAFGGLPHRMELLADAGGVRFYDDSKGTNVGAVAASLSGFPRPFVLIAGGRHKGASYAPLRDVLAGRCRALVLLGEAAEQMAAELAGVAPIHRVGSMDEAVEAAARAAGPGDAVVLSPACSSFDMFRDYEHRAEAFAAAVRRVTHERP